MLKSLSATLAGCVVTAISFTHASAFTFKSWEVASEFSDSSNPSNAGVGPFSYGAEAALDTTLFSAMLSPYSGFLNPPITGWTPASGVDYPHVVHNNTNITQPKGATTYPPHALALHPGPACAYAVVRFTAPKKGKYKISGQFYASDNNLGVGTTTDVHISTSINPTVPVYNGVVNFGAGAISASFTTKTLSLPLNGTVDFQVGCGSNGTNANDTTGLNAVIETRK